jgi:hypothetical protein
MLNGGPDELGFIRPCGARQQRVQGDGQSDSDVGVAKLGHVFVVCLFHCQFPSGFWVTTATANGLQTFLNDDKNAEYSLAVVTVTSFVVTSSD